MESGMCLCLYGAIGAGKTTFTKGLAEGLGISDNISSPTFTLMNEYASGRIPLYHFDAYRLENPQDVEHTALEEYFGNGVLLIEWAELIEGLITQNTEPGKRVNIYIDYQGDTSRTIRIAHI